MTDVTKSCVLMLKFERTVYKVLKYPFRKFFNYLRIIYNFILGIINWCIIRSFIRLFGFPLIIWITWSGITFAANYSGPTDAWSVFITLLWGTFYLLLIMGMAIFYIYVWVNIPDKEKFILHGERNNDY